MKVVSENSFWAIYLSRLDLPLAEQLNIKKSVFINEKVGIQRNLTKLATKFVKKYPKHEGTFAVPE